MASPTTSTDQPQRPKQEQGQQQQQISNPRRLLLLSPTTHSLTTIPPLLQTLTGTPVTPPADTEMQTFAGYTTHPPLRIETKYYRTEVPIWVDEIPLQTGELEKEIGGSKGEGEGGKASPTQWKTEFSGPEAKVVRDAIAGLVIVIRNPESTTTNESTEDITSRKDITAILELIKAIAEVKGVIEEERGGMGDVLGMLVLVGPDADKLDGGVKKDEDGLDGGDDDLGEEAFSVPWWEDQLYELGVMGFEVVNWDPKREDDGRRNRYGELQGMRRIKEVLETHDWTPSADPIGFGELEEHLLGEESGFNLEVNELEREMVGLRMAIENPDEDEDEEGVDSMEGLLLRLQAIKDMSAELPEEERKRFAAKAVGDIMKEI